MNTPEATGPFRLVVVSAGISDPSSTRMLADRAAERAAALAAQRGNAVTVSVIDLREISADISTALISQLITPKLQQAIAALGEADGTLFVPDLDPDAELNFGGLGLEGSRPAANGEHVPVRRLDDLDLPACHFLKVDVEGMERAALAGAAAQGGLPQRVTKQLMDGLDHQHGTIAILDIGGVHLGTDQQTASIGHNVALTPFNLLGRIVTPRPTALRSLDRLAVDDPRRRARVAARDFARL